MDEKEVRTYLRENLSIRIQTEYSYDPDGTDLLHLELVLEDEVISSLIFSAKS